MLFVSLFRSAKTAAKYIAHIAWACTFFSLPLEWVNFELRQMLQGLRKRGLRVAGGAARVKFLLNSALVERVCALAAPLSFHLGFAACVRLAWSFLLRVESECVPLLAGAVEDGC